MKNKIISIQSKLVYGYVGANIAELAIQLHGLDVISFPTVLLSAHTGHQPIHGQAIAKELFDELILGIEAIDVIDTSACVITGYIGTKDILQSASQFIQKIKEADPNMLYICDPVMGDISDGLYIPEEVASNIISKLLPLCDILTPNHFELGYILGKQPNTIDEVVNLVSANAPLSKKILIVTSCNLNDTPQDQIETIVVKDGIATRIYSPRVDVDTTGTGDLFTSILSAQLTIGNNIISATTKASGLVSKALNHAVEAGYDEMNAACLVKYIRSTDE